MVAGWRDAYSVCACEDFHPAAFAFVGARVEHDAKLLVEGLWVGIRAELAQCGRRSFGVATADEPVERNQLFDQMLYEAGVLTISEIRPGRDMLR